MNAGVKVMYENYDLLDSTLESTILPRYLGIHYIIFNQVVTTYKLK